MYTRVHVCAHVHAYACTYVCTYAREGLALEPWLDQCTKPSSVTSIPIAKTLCFGVGPGLLVLLLNH